MKCVISSNKYYECLLRWKNLKYNFEEVFLLCNKIPQHREFVLLSAQDYNYSIHQCPFFKEFCIMKTSFKNNSIFVYDKKDIVPIEIKKIENVYRGEEKFS